MTFLNPAMLWGLLGVVVPVVLALWGRRRPRRVVFPSLRLITVAQRQQRSVSRIREWLIMVLRMALIALASCALAQPVVGPMPPGWLTRASGTVVVLCDTSASMAYGQGGASCAARARQAAQIIASSQPAGTRVHALAADQSVRSLGPGPDPWHNAVPLPVRGRLLDALNATELPEVWDADSRVFLITDLQESSLQGRLVRALPQSPVVVDVGMAQAVNHAVTDVLTRSACPLQSRPLDLEARVSSWPTNSPAELGLAAQVNGREVPGRTVRVVGGKGRALVRVDQPQGGDLSVVLSLPPDALPEDDRFRCVTRVRDTLSVAIVTGRSDPRFARLALNPGGPADTRIRTSVYRWPDLPASLQTDAVVVTDIPGTGTAGERILGWLRSGCGLVLFTGPDTMAPPQLMERLLGGKAALGPVLTATVQEPLRLAELNVYREPLAAFATPRAGDLLAFRFTACRALEAGEDARILARFSNGVPAVLSTRAPGQRAIIVNTTLDRRWTNAPDLAGFVPFLHRLIYEVVGPVPRLWPDWYAGETMHVPCPAGAQGPVRITGPDGQETTVSPAGGQWRFAPPRPGFYRVRWQEGDREVREHFAVNLNPLESNPARVTAAELRRRLRAPGAAVVTLEHLGAKLSVSEGHMVNLTHGLWVLTALLLVVETLITAGRFRAPKAEGGIT